MWWVLSPRMRLERMLNVVRSTWLWKCGALARASEPRLQYDEVGGTDHV